MLTVLANNTEEPKLTINVLVVKTWGRRGTLAVGGLLMFAGLHF